MKNGEKPRVNPFVMLREEFDDWAVLFDPDTSHGFGLNPTGVYLWRLLDGERTIDDLIGDVRHYIDDVPEDVSDHIGAFVDALVAQGLAGYGDSDKGSYREKCSHAPLGAMNEVKPFTYEPPRLVNLNSGAAVSGKTCTGHGSNGASCTSGSGASVCCSSGTCVDVSHCTYGNGNLSCCGYGDCIGGYDGCCDYGSCASQSPDSSCCSYGYCTYVQAGYCCGTGDCAVMPESPGYCNPYGY